MLLLQTNYTTWECNQDSAPICLNITLYISAFSTAKSIRKYMDDTSSSRIPIRGCRVAFVWLDIAKYTTHLLFRYS
jgi:hypothetical protein